MVENTSEFSKDLIKNYSEGTHGRFTTFTWKNKNWKSWKIAANLYDKKEYVIGTGKLKQTLNHGLVLKKVDKAIKFNQEAWLKLYIDMNTEWFWKTFF